MDQHSQNTALSMQKWRLAIEDIFQSFISWQIWYILAMQDVKLRYRRTTLGPFWITLSMAIKIYAMGFIYGKLFNIDIQVYLPYLATGMIAWELISGLISESLSTFTGSAGPIKEMKLAYCIYQQKTIFRNFVIFFHNAIVIVPLILFFHKTFTISFNILALLPNLIILYIIGFIYGTLLAMISARYNDIAQIIQSLIQVFFFVTPVMWHPERIHNHWFQLFCQLNPLYALVQLIREPLLGQPTSAFAYIMSGFLITLGTICFLQLFTKYRSRIVFWL